MVRSGTKHIKVGDSFLNRNEKICGIYKITSPSGRIYIGQSIDIYKRYYTHKSRKYRMSQPLLYNSFKKYGFEHHSFEIIHQCVERDLNILEMLYVDLFNCFNTPAGLNLREGGGGTGKLSDTTKQKIKKWYLDNPEKAKEKNKNLMNKMRFDNPNTGRIHTKESNNKKSNSLIKYNKENRRKIKQLDLTGNEINIFSHAKEASIITKINITQIRQCASKKPRLHTGRKMNTYTAGGFKWEYVL